MQKAEAQLIDFALSKFGNKEEASAEVIDTPIPSSVIPFKYPPSQQNDAAGENLTIHGSKVVYHGGEGQQQSDSSCTPLVVLHGYAAASLHFYRNLFGLAKHGFGTVYALDWLGFGLSSRPRFELENDSVEVTETFFVECLEAWREARGIPKMILAGHSMGGYLSVAYSEKYPQHVERLILLSPVGVPHRVEQSDNPNSLRSGTNVEADDATTNTSAAKELPPLTYPQQVWKHLWDYHRLSYGTIARYMLEPVGRAATNFTLGDYMTPTERKVMTDYLYANMVLPTSGDHAINYILTSRYYARKPTVYRIPKLIQNHQIPVAFIYGDRDIMPVEGGLEVRSRCGSSSTNTIDNQHLVQIFVIKDAGHALNWKHPEEFNTAVLLSGGMQVSPDMPQPRAILGEQ